MREYQVRICERLGVQFPGPTRRLRSISSSNAKGSDGWYPDCPASRRALPDQPASKAAAFATSRPVGSGFCSGSRIAQSLFGSRSVSRSVRVGSEYLITDRTDQLRYEQLPYFTITATSATWPFIALAHAPNVIRPWPSAGRRPRTRSFNSAIASASISSRFARGPPVAVVTCQ